MTRVRRKAKRIGWTPTLARLEAKLWAAIREQAIERAFGL